MLGWMWKNAQPSDWGLSFTYKHTHTNIHTHTCLIKHCQNQKIFLNMARSSRLPFFSTLSINLPSHSQLRLGDSLLKQKKSCSSILYLDPFDHMSLSAAFYSTLLCSVNYRFGYMWTFFHILCIPRRPDITLPLDGLTLTGEMLAFSCCDANQCYALERPCRWWIRNLIPCF